MENSNNTGLIIGSLVVGALIGGALGVLFAPDKGSETRKKIAGSAGDLTDSIKQKFNSLVNDVKHEFETEKTNVSGFAAK